MIEGLSEKPWAPPGFRHEDPEQLHLIVELRQHVPGRHGELSLEVAQRTEDASDVAQGVETGQVALDAGPEHRLLRREVMVEAAGSGGETGRRFDLGHRRVPVPLLSEKVHGLVDDAIPGRT